MKKLENVFAYIIIIILFLTSLNVFLHEYSTTNINIFLTYIMFSLFIIYQLDLISFEKNKLNKSKENRIEEKTIKKCDCIQLKLSFNEEIKEENHPFVYNNLLSYIFYTIYLTFSIYFLLENILINEIIRYFLIIIIVCMYIYIMKKIYNSFNRKLLNKYNSFFSVYDWV